MADLVFITLNFHNIIKENLFSENNSFDFGKIIPEPKTEAEYLASGGERYKKPEDDCIMIDKSRPWFNWYDWHFDHWDTKWNAMNTEIIDDNTIKFCTAYCFPNSVIQKLSTMYPDIKITCTAEYEAGPSQHLVYHNGNRSSYWL